VSCCQQRHLADGTRLTLATLGSATQIETTLFECRWPRWPRQVERLEVVSRFHTFSVQKTFQM
jgi:hypothetical protein